MLRSTSPMIWRPVACALFFCMSVEAWYETASYTLAKFCPRPDMPDMPDCRICRTVQAGPADAGRKPTLAAYSKLVLKYGRLRGRTRHEPRPAKRSCPCIVQSAVMRSQEGADSVPSAGTVNCQDCHGRYSK